MRKRSKRNTAPKIHLMIMIQGKKAQLKGERAEFCQIMVKTN